MDYTDQECSENYLHIQLALEHIEKGEPNTPEWLQEQKEFIMTIHEHFGDNLKNANADIQSKQFRVALEEASLLMSHLMDEIVDMGDISIPPYRKFCKLMIFVLEYIVGSDELADMMGDITMS